MTAPNIEITWLDRREKIVLLGDVEATLQNAALANLIAAHRSGEVVQVLGIPIRVLAFDGAPTGPTEPFRFTIEDARTE